jgi:2-hydroxychromene-2-carboxylate isomerase
MPAPIVFYFDFSSPYSYLASEQIGDLAARHGRAVDYRPTLLGAAFRASGQRPLVDIPMKGEYSRRDMARSARFAGIDFRIPEKFPISTVLAARVLMALQAEPSDRAQPFLHSAFRAYFAQGRDISETAVIRELLLGLGADADAVLAAAAQPGLKDQLKQAVDASIAGGVFGAPYFVVDGEPFWGFDRLPQVERWLASGPY